MSIFQEAQRIHQLLTQEEEISVDVALFGQPGAGKSSLINRLTGQKLAPEGVKTDMTQESHSYEWNGLKLTDLPGYGTLQFPKETYLHRFNVWRYDVFLCVFSGKFRDEDSEFFRELKTRNRPCIFVRNKADDIWEEDKSDATLREEIAADLQKHLHSKEPLLFTSCRTREGISELEYAIASLLEGAKQDRFFRGAKAYTEDFLEQKKKSCERFVAMAAGSSAVNAINPVPGLDIAVDLSLLLALFKRIRSSFGLTDERLKTKDFATPTLAQVAQNIVKYGAEDGIVMLLQRFAGRIATREVTKWIPLIGQAIAASAGYAITLAAGKSYLNDCYTLARAILDKELVGASNQ